MKRSALMSGVLGAVLMLPLASAFAAPHAGAGMGATPTNPNTRSGNAFGHPGAPAVSCQSIGVSPGHAANSPGAPFNEPTDTSAGGNAGLHYAGNVPQSSKNTASVSQYDVACANAAAHGH